MSLKHGPNITFDAKTNHGSRNGFSRLRSCDSKNNFYYCQNNSALQESRQKIPATTTHYRHQDGLNSELSYYSPETSCGHSLMELHPTCLACARKKRLLPNTRIREKQVARDNQWIQIITKEETNCFSTKMLKDKERFANQYSQDVRFENKNPPHLFTTCVFPSNNASKKDVHQPHKIVFRKRDAARECFVKVTRELKIFKIPCVKRIYGPHIIRVYCKTFKQMGAIGCILHQLGERNLIQKIGMPIEWESRHKSLVMYIQTKSKEETFKIVQIFDESPLKYNIAVLDVAYEDDKSIKRQSSSSDCLTKTQDFEKIIETETKDQKCFTGNGKLTKNVTFMIEENNAMIEEENVFEDHLQENFIYNGATKTTDQNTNSLLKKSSKPKALVHDERNVREKVQETGNVTHQILFVAVLGFLFDQIIRFYFN